MIRIVKVIINIIKCLLITFMNKQRVSKRNVLLIHTNIQEYVIYKLFDLIEYIDSPSQMEVTRNLREK